MKSISQKSIKIFAVTINTAQSQTLKVVGIDLRTQCFSHDQFYVGYSQVSNPHSLFIYALDKTKILYTVLSFNKPIDIDLSPNSYLFYQVVLLHRYPPVVPYQLLLLLSTKYHQLHCNYMTMVSVLK